MTGDTFHDALRRALKTDSDPGGLSPVESLRSLQRTKVAFYEELARVAAPAFNAALTERNADNLETQRDLCAWANQTLAELGLAVRCPKTGKPALLLVDVRSAADEVGRYRLEVRDDHGRPQRTLCSTTLPVFELTEHRDRIESLVDRARRQREGGRSR